MKSLSPCAPVVGVVLAGGRSSRMGGVDKCLLPLAGRPIIAHVIERLGRCVAELAINANGAPERFADFGLPVLRDGVEGSVGPLAGILAAMDWAAGRGYLAVVTAAGDTPFFPRDLVTVLRAAGREAGNALAVAATPEGAHPVFGLWPVELRGELRRAIGAGQRRVMDWARGQGAAVAMFEGASDQFFNVNTPEDLAAARAMLS